MLKLGRIAKAVGRHDDGQTDVDSGGLGGCLGEKAVDAVLGGSEGNESWREQPDGPELATEEFQLRVDLDEAVSLLCDHVGGNDAPFVVGWHRFKQRPGCNLN